MVSSTNQNLRLNPDTGTLTGTDGALAYASGDANQNANPNIVAAAYADSFSDATNTILYHIDSVLNVLATQNPPNSGTLNTQGGLGVNTTVTVNFDIAVISGVNVGYATLRVGTTTTLYTINLANGTAVQVGNIGGNPVLTGMSVSLEPKTFVVTNRIDPGDGNCTAGSCTLREAITAANENPGVDRIEFEVVVGSGVRTFTPETPLPQITSPVIIDGYTQSGAAAATADQAATILIELDGSSAGPFANGLAIAGGRSIIRGLAINRFAGAGILVLGGNASGGGNIIEGCYLGLDPGGTIPRPNAESGIALRSSGNTLGGTMPAARNVISGNTLNGVDITHSMTLNNQILGNYIGTDATGTVDLGNGEYGVNIAAPSHDVGGIVPGSGNVISGNGEGGIRVASSNAQPQPTSRAISSGPMRAAPVIWATPGPGVFIEGAPDTIVGGGKDGEGRNVISGNVGIRSADRRGRRNRQSGPGELHWHRCHRRRATRQQRSGHTDRSRARQYSRRHDPGLSESSSPAMAGRSENCRRWRHR